jgi:23S rRNA pseudouridine2605 synthase
MPSQKHPQKHPKKKQKPSLLPMTDELHHPADAPEQEITSEAPEFAIEQVEPTIEDGGVREAHIPQPEVSTQDDDGAIDDAAVIEGVDEDETESEPGAAESRPAPKLERLQKILAQAGIASRRHAEELITEGRVQVNGQTVTVLGSKADPEHDHIRVDGKLLHGAERLRYFVLNKPKGYVTTVTDPEHRPTVMDFFAKLNERVYPVGRLDYLSEGLLLFTNDGDLANRLTKAASGVEKTYLVKVSGQPGEDQLDRLREGVAIERTKPGEGKVHTARSRIRQVRQGDNPWYEVVLIEGRNRELRKMFEEIGHHVEKIRRVGYGPLVLDLEPGKVRELDADEVRKLRLTAEGKLKPRPFKTVKMLPKEAGQSTEQRIAKADRRRPNFARREDRREKTSSRPKEQAAGSGPRRQQSPHEAQPRFERPRAEGPGTERRRNDDSQARPGRYGQRTDARGPVRPRGEAKEAAPRFDRGRSNTGQRPNDRGFRADSRPRTEGPSGRADTRPQRASERPQSPRRFDQSDARPPRFKSDRPSTGKPGRGVKSGFGSKPSFGSRPKPFASRSFRSAEPGSEKPVSRRTFDKSGARPPRFESDRSSSGTPGRGVKPGFGSKPSFGSRPKPFASKSPRSAEPGSGPPRKGGYSGRGAQRFDSRPRGKRPGPPKGKKRD